MAGVDVGGGSGHKRATNSDINMVPFIDLLFVTIAFLLITAVWVTNSRLSASAQVPGPPGCGADCSTPPAKALHVSIGESAFGLVWKQGATVVSERQVPKQGVAVGGDGSTVRYPDLAKAIQAEWTQSGDHRDPSDAKNDQAVLHTDDRMPFKDMVAVLDAINGATRDLKLPSGSVAKVPAFQMTLAAK